VAEVRFIDAAVEDLRRLPASVLPRVLKKLVLLEENPKAGRPLGGPLSGFRKLVVGNRDWRIVYRETPDGAVEVCEVWAVGARADDEIYEEVRGRVAALPASPTAHALGEVLARLGRVGPAASPAEAETLPGWLVERLVMTAGLARSAVERMTPDEALDAWTAYQLRKGR
jgi:mRNA interferase RelE/StbE